MSGVNGDAHLYEDRFTVTEYSQEKYDRVARIKANSNDNSTLLELDLNIELYPCQPGEELNVVLATTLSLDGSKDENKGWRGQLANADEQTLADQFDYVCYGKIYKFEEAEDQSSIKAFLSFGGLLMCLEGPFKKLTALRVEYCYLLIRK